MRAACRKGVMIIAYGVAIGQSEAGRFTARWLADKLHGRGRIVAITACPEPW